MAGTRTTSAAPSLTAERLRGAVPTAAFALAVLLIEAALAAGLVTDRLSQLLVLFAAVAAVALLFRFPMVSAMTMLALTDFILYPTLFTFPVGPIELRPFEPILVGLLAVAVLRPRRHTWGGAAGVFLAIFLVLVLISGIQAHSSGRADLVDVLSWGRALGLLTFFYVVVRLFPTREQRRTLLLGGAVIAAATGVVALLVALGWSFGDVLKGESTQIIQQEEGLGGVQRVRLAGLSLGYALFWYVATQIVLNRGARRAGWAVLLTGIAIDIAVSFNRNMWLGLVVGLLLMMAVAGPLVRGRFALVIAAGVTGVALITLVGAGAEGRLVDPVVERASTILSPSDVTRESSLVSREAETEAAWEVARSNLSIGVGVGAPFGVYDFEPVGTDSYERTAQLFLHNQYLYLLLIGGLGGLVAFVAFLGVPTVTALRRARRDPAITACGIGIAMIMVSSVVAIYFTVEDMTVVLALLAGLIVADSESRAETDGLP